MAKNKNLTIRVDPEWRDRLDAWIKKQPLKPSIGQAIRLAVERMIGEGKNQK